jgi:hypothetical protein
MKRPRKCLERGMQEENITQAYKPRRRSTTYQIRIQLGVLDQATLKTSPRPQTGSVFDILQMYGKLEI